MEDDSRIKNAKARLSDKGRRMREEKEPEGEEGEKDDKRRRLQEMEERAMVEEDPEKLAKLFEDYRVEYQRVQEDREEDKKRRKLEDIEEELMGTEIAKRTAELYQEYMREHKRQKGERPMREAASGSGDPARYEESVKMNIDQILAEEWMDQEREAATTYAYPHGDPGDPSGDLSEYAWDDVNNFELPMNLVREARKEEMKHMKEKIFKVVKKSEAYRVTGKGPISTKWVDTDKSHGNGEMLVRSRWVARDFKDKGEKDREDLFSATPPLELVRYLLSRQATRRRDGQERKTLYIDVKKAHLVPKCTQDVYVELPAEAGAQADECGKLEYWLYGCRPALREGLRGGRVPETRVLPRGVQPRSPGSDRCGPWG